MERGQFEASDEELLGELRRVEIARGENKEDAERRATALVELLKQQSALLAPEGPHRWRFVHATLGEYLAGVDLARGGPRWKTVMGDLFRADWFEVVAFAAGELGRRADDERMAELVSAALVKRKGRYPATDALLIGSILDEDPRMLIPLQRSLVDRLLELSWDKTYSSRSVEAVAANLKKLAMIHRERRWGAHFAKCMVERLRSPDPEGWLERHMAIAAVAEALCHQLEVQDTAAILAAMERSTCWYIQLRAIRWRVGSAPISEREAEIAKALWRHQELEHYRITGVMRDAHPEPSDLAWKTLTELWTSYLDGLPWPGEVDGPF